MLNNKGVAGAVILAVIGVFAAFGIIYGSKHEHYNASHNAPVVIAEPVK